MTNHARLYEALSPIQVYAPAKFESIPHAMARNAKAHPDRRLLLCEGRSVTWGEFDKRVNRVANALLAMGLQKRDKVAVLASTSIEYVEVILGTLRAGGCIVPLSAMSTSEQLEGMIDDADSRVLLLSAEMRPLAEPFLRHLSGLLPGGRIAFDFKEDGVQTYEAWLAGASDQDPGIEIGPEDHFNIIYSSGTTGIPKGILHDHQLRWGMVHRFAGRGFDSSAVSIVSTPLYSNTTAVCFYPMFACGGSVVLMKKFDVKQFLELSQSERVTHAMLVPVQYQRILAHADFDKYDLSTYRSKFSTSAPLRLETKRQIAKRWPGGMFESYGLTEGGGNCSLDVMAFPDKIHTVGKPGAGVDVRIIDDKGNELPQGEVGEIVGRGPSMMVGYYKQPEKTLDMLWKSPEGITFFRSGDMGRFDEDGFLILLDRKKDMIITGGFNVYAADLEAVLSQHPDVTDVAVIGIPSDQWGETPMALVVRRTGANVDGDTLREWANAKLGKLQRIAAVDFRDDLPRSTIGKILKKELRAPFWESVGRKI